MASRQMSKPAQVTRRNISKEMYEAITNRQYSQLDELSKHASEKDVLITKVNEEFTVLTSSVWLDYYSGFALLLDKFRIQPNKVDIAGDLLSYISVCANPIMYLKKFVDSYATIGFDGKFLIGDYCDKPRNTLVTTNEIHLMLDAPSLFDVSPVTRANNLSVNAAYLLYKEGGDANRTVDVLRTIGSKGNEALMIDALSKHAPLNIIHVLSSILRDYLQVGDALPDVLAVLAPSRHDIYLAIKDVVTYPFNTRNVLYISNEWMITEQKIEVMIMNNPNVFQKGSVLALKAIGVKLARSSKSRQLVGEKIAFNCDPSVWKELHDYGFDFSRCATDLLIEVSSTKVDKNDVIELLKYIKKLYDVQVPYFRYTTNTDVKNYLYTICKERDNTNTGTFVRHMLGNKLAEAKASLNKGIVWKNVTTFEWIDHVTTEFSRHPLLEEGLTLAWRRLENGILRCVPYTPHQLAKNYERYLRIITRFKNTVEVATDYLTTSIYIGSTRVHIEFDVTREGKYRGLDLFSENGDVLETREDVQRRRRLLQTVYA